MVDYRKLYGALSNMFFRFYRIEAGESTTATGRAIVTHQARMVNKYFGSDYNVNFPLYDTVKDAEEAGKSPNVALHGPLFNGVFQSPHVISGDTDSSYFKTGANNKADAIKIADDVADYINASYQGFMQRTFLCNPGYDNIIKCGREIVSDRGIFVGKKLYILHLVNLDGKDVNKMKVMGLSIKKTTIPKDISDVLETFIERLLLGEDWTVVSQSIVDYKDSLRKPDSIMNIGLPKGVNGVEDYTKQYQIYGDGARLPGGVSAAICWNTCLDEYNDKVSPRLVSGSKIRTFYIKSKIGRFKSIAVPTDIERIPDWFVDNIQPTIDIDAQLIRLVDKPLQTILQAIGVTVPTKQSMLVDSLVVW